MVQILMMNNIDIMHIFKYIIYIKLTFVKMVVNKMPIVLILLRVE
jgi:hypothetical protein